MRRRLLRRTLVLYHTIHHEALLVNILHDENHKLK